MESRFLRTRFLFVLALSLAAPQAVPGTVRVVAQASFIDAVPRTVGNGGKRGLAVLAEEHGIFAHAVCAPVTAHAREGLARKARRGGVEPWKRQESPSSVPGEPLNASIDASRTLGDDSTATSAHPLRCGRCSTRESQYGLVDAKQAWTERLCRTCAIPNAAAALPLKGRCRSCSRPAFFGPRTSSTSGPSDMALSSASGKAGRGVGFAIHCSEHRLPNEQDFVHSTCDEEGCERQPTWVADKVVRRTGEKMIGGEQTRHCAKHRGITAVRMKGPRCADESCDRIPSYGDPLEKRAMYCGAHRRADDVDLKNARCRAPRCAKLASYGVPGARPLCCAEHKEPHHSDLKNRKCRWVSGNVKCSTQASYGFVASKRPIFCKEHSLEDHVDLRNRKCAFPEGCTNNPSFGASAGARRYCKEHKDCAVGANGGVVLLRKALCQHPDGCTSPARFGDSGSVPQFCFRHCHRTHVNLKTPQTLDVVLSGKPDDISPLAPLGHAAMQDVRRGGVAAVAGIRAACGGAEEEVASEVDCDSDLDGEVFGSDEGGGPVSDATLKQENQGPQSGPWCVCLCARTCPPELPLATLGWCTVHWMGICSQWLCRLHILDKFGTAVQTVSGRFWEEDWIPHVDGFEEDPEGGRRAKSGEQWPPGGGPDPAGGGLEEEDMSLQEIEEELTRRGIPLRPRKALLTAVLRLSMDAERRAFGLPLHPTLPAAGNMYRGTSLIRNRPPP